jgi:RHS repeat-associated protein
MNGQTDCSSPHSSDLEIQYTHDTWGRLTKVEKPAGNCTFWEYDAEGRLEKIKERDDCNAGSSGHTIEHTYSLDGLQVETEYKDAAGAVTYRQESEYRADRRLAKLINPVAPSYSRDFDYHDDGMLAEIVFEDGLGKQELDYDDLNRQEELRRYTDSMSFDTWDLTPTEQLDLLAEVEDDDAKALSWVHDDFGRRVKQVSPDSGTTIWVYDRAGSLTDMIVAVGTAGELHHTYTYDDLYRRTTSLFEKTFFDCGASQGADIQTAYDALPSGISCPTGAGCENLEGRTAYIKSLMLCDTNEPDDTIDQETFFSYDDAGRLASTFVRDDTGRTAKTSYSWDENGNLVELERPSGGVMAWTYGSTSSNSDRDKITELLRKVGTSYETVVGDIEYQPFGPMSAYRQENEKNSNPVEVKLTQNLAYRPTEILWEEETSGTDLFEIAYTEDEKGRTVAREFSGGQTDLQDAWYTYDDMDRVLCDAATSGACPTTGSSLKTTLDGSPPYSASGDRTSVKHNSLVYGETSHPYTYVTGSDKLDEVGNGTGDVEYAFDDRGNRTSDDDSELGGVVELDDDRRNFGYDGRGNLSIVGGNYKRDALDDWRWYLLLNVYDERNHRTFKVFYDNETFSSGEAPQWFYYHDAFDRLIEVKHLPDATDTDTYSIYQFFWLGNRPIYYVQIDYPGQTTSRRYLHADEINRPLEAYSHPTSGDTQRVWAINPDLFGWDDIIEGAAVYQPLRFPGQLVDPETTAWADFDDPARPPLHDNHHRVYDPFTGMYLQTDPDIESTWASYGYAEGNPVRKVDPKGRRPRDEWGPDGEIDAVCKNLGEFGGIDFHLCQSPIDFWIPPGGTIVWGGGGGGSGGGFGGGGAGGDFDDITAEREDCVPLGVGECDECCYRNYNNVDAPRCRRIPKWNIPARALCWADAAAIMGGCIASCPRDDLGPLATPTWDWERK